MFPDTLLNLRNPLCAEILPTEVGRYFKSPLQLQTHGYANRILSPIYNYRAPTPVVLQKTHASFDLTHHLVFATTQRKGVFTSTTEEALTRYWLGVAAKREFAIDQISSVPDHLH